MMTTADAAKSLNLNAVSEIQMKIGGRQAYYSCENRQTSVESA